MLANFSEVDLHTCLKVGQGHSLSIDFNIFSGRQLIWSRQTQFA